MSGFWSTMWYERYSTDVHNFIIFLKEAFTALNLFPKKKTKSVNQSVGDTSYNAFHSSKNNLQLTVNHWTISLIFNFSRVTYICNFSLNLVKVCWLQQPKIDYLTIYYYQTTGTLNNTRLLTSSIHTLPFLPAYLLLLPPILTADILHIFQTFVLLLLLLLLLTHNLY